MNNVQRFRDLGLTIPSALEREQTLARLVDRYVIEPKPEAGSRAKTQDTHVAEGAD